MLKYKKCLKIFQNGSVNFFNEIKLKNFNFIEIYEKDYTTNYKFKIKLKKNKIINKIYRNKF